MMFSFFMVLRNALCSRWCMRENPLCMEMGSSKTCFLSIIRFSVFWSLQQKHIRNISSVYCTDFESWIWIINELTGFNFIWRFPEDGGIYCRFLKTFSDAETSLMLISSFSGTYTVMLWSVSDINARARLSLTVWDIEVRDCGAPVWPGVPSAPERENSQMRRK